jgi:5-methylcytosine-specific restriction endonuclease McrA
MGHTVKLWAADRHKYGAGKVHVVDIDDDTRTYCGKRLAAFPGSETRATVATCQNCLSSSVSRPHEKAEAVQRRQEYDARVAQQAQEKSEHDRQWWAWYDAYLMSPKWRAISARVIARADDLCEGCGESPATQAHHLTYENVGEEFLWELRAVCRACHQRLHELRDKRRAEYSR